MENVDAPEVDSSETDPAQGLPTDPIPSSSIPTDAKVHFEADAQGRKCAIDAAGDRIY